MPNSSPSYVTYVAPEKKSSPMAKSPVDAINMTTDAIVKMYNLKRNLIYPDSLLALMDTQVVSSKCPIGFPGWKQFRAALEKYALGTTGLSGDYGHRIYTWGLVHTYVMPDLRRFAEIWELKKKAGWI